MGGAHLVDVLQGARRLWRDQWRQDTQPITRQHLARRTDLPARTASLNAARLHQLVYVHLALGRQPRLADGPASTLWTFKRDSWPLARPPVGDQPDWQMGPAPRCWGPEKAMEGSLLSCAASCVRAVRVWWGHSQKRWRIPTAPTRV